MTTVKHLGVFLEQEKQHMRKNKSCKFYFLEGGRDQFLERGKYPKENDKHEVSGPWNVFE